MEPTNYYKHQCSPQAVAACYPFVILSVSHYPIVSKDTGSIPWRAHSFFFLPLSSSLSFFPQLDFSKPAPNSNSGRAHFFLSLYIFFFSSFFSSFFLSPFLLSSSFLLLFHLLLLPFPLPPSFSSSISLPIFSFSLSPAFVSLFLPFLSFS